MKKSDIIIGKFCPIHIGHERSIGQLRENPIIVLVGSEKVSKKSPLPVSYREYLIRKIFPGISISVSPNGFIPGIVNHFSKTGVEVQSILAGEDRVFEYEKKIRDYHVEPRPRVIMSPRITSATFVRECLMNGDIEKFRELTNSKIWEEYETLRGFVNNG